MNRTLANRRRLRVAWAIAWAVAALIAAALVRAGWDNRFAPPPAPGLAAPSVSVEAVETVRVVAAEGRYELSRDARGRWFMRERGGYPVRTAMVEQLLHGLGDLRLTAPMTADADKHDRLGLGDPERGGAGIRLQALDAKGALLADLTLGEAQGALYARRTNEAQTWAAEGALPPLRSAAAWLDLSPFQIAAVRFARVDLAPPAGPPYSILRESVDDPRFFVGAPFSRWPTRDVDALAQTAGKLGALEPLDVAPAPSIEGPARARVLARTFDGLVLDSELHQARGGWWVKLTARSDSPQTAPEADIINRRTGPWAFRIAPEAAALLAPPLDAVIARPQPS